jgi:hypothetical protein
MGSRRLDDQVADPGGEAEDRRRGAGTPGHGDAPAPAPEPAAPGDDRGDVERLGRVIGRAGVAGPRPERPAQGIGV